MQSGWRNFDCSLFLTPFCIGIPLLIFGIVKLVEGFTS